MNRFTALRNSFMRMEYHVSKCNPRMCNVVFSRSFSQTQNESKHHTVSSKSQPDTSNAQHVLTSEEETIRDEEIHPDWLAMERRVKFRKLKKRGNSLS